MSDSGSTPQRDIDKFIKEALKVWEEFGFKDIDLWEIFQHDFEGFTEEDFRSASIHHQRKLRTYLRKYGVWVRKQQRYTIALSLYELLLEEEPTPWTEAEITACDADENFDSNKISRLIDSDFGRKPRKFRALTPTSPTGPPPAATSPTPALSAPAPVNTPIYPTQPPGIGLTPAAYGMQRSGARPAAYTKLSVIRPTPVVHTQPSSMGPAYAVQIYPSTINPLAAITTNSIGYIQTSPLGPPAAATLSVPAPFVSLSASPTSPGEVPVSTSSGSPTLAPVNAFNILPSTTFVPPPTQPTGTRPASAVVTTSTSHASLVDHPRAITPTSTGLGRDMSNLAKIYTHEAKYSGRNNSSMFKLAKLWKNALNNLSKNFRIGSTGRRRLCQAMKWMT